MGRKKERTEVVRDTGKNSNKSSILILATKSEI